MRKESVYRSRGAQIAEYLRSCITANQWPEWLPSERELAVQTGVARRTIRAALQELERDGWVTERGPKGTRVAPRRQRRRKEGERSVGFLIHNYHPGVRVDKHPILLEIARGLERVKTRLEVHRVSYLSGDRLSASFVELMSKVHHDLWILSTPTAAIERWFRKQKLPAIVYGSGNAEVGLPSFSQDFKALGRHAAGEMLRLGHRRLALILSRRMNSENMETLRGFESALAEGRHAGAGFELYEHRESREDLHRLVDRLLRQKVRPTAWLIGQQEFYTAIHTYLLYKRIAIPGEISLVSRNSGPYLDALFPRPASYREDSLLAGRGCARMAIRAMEGHEQEHHRVMADFLPGETLDACR